MIKFNLAATTYHQAPDDDPEDFPDELEVIINRMCKLVCKNTELKKKLSDGYFALWKRNQSKSQQLKDCRERFDREITELRDQNECVTRQLEARNERLEAKCNGLEDGLIEEKDKVTRLENQNETLERSLERISDELRDAAETLNETKGELRMKTEEHRELALKLKILDDKLSWTVEKHEIEKAKAARDGDLMSVELKLEKHRNAGLNATVSEQKARLQSQADALEELNRKNEELKRTIAAERVRAADSSNALKRENSRAVNGKEDAEQRLMECMKRSQCAVLENERLKSENGELRCRLDAAVKDGDEERKSFVEKFKRMDERMKELLAEMNSKNRINSELEEQLWTAKQMRYKAAEKERVKNFERKLKNVRQWPDEPYSGSSSRTVNARCSSTSFFRSSSTVLDEPKSTDGYSFSSYDTVLSIPSSAEKPRKFTSEYGIEH